MIHLTSDVEINWADILSKFSSYEGTIVAFCKENGIKPHQLYYHRKKASSDKVGTTPLFHGIKINEKEPIRTDIQADKLGSKLDTKIKIEIGKAKIYISGYDLPTLENILKIVTSIC